MMAMKTPADKRKRAAIKFYKNAPTRIEIYEMLKKLNGPDEDVAYRKKIENSIA